mgnify:CR=1 FL=1
MIDLVLWRFAQRSIYPETVSIVGFGEDKPDSPAR